MRLVALGSLLLASPAVSLRPEAYETRSGILDGAR
jgi:hypothetical protein